jgi:hypothetical protein
LPERLASASAQVQQVMNGYESGSDRQPAAVAGVANWNILDDNWNARPWMADVSC